MVAPPNLIPDRYDRSVWENMRRIQAWATGISAGGGAAVLSVSAGTVSTTLASLVFSNSNNVTFGLNGSTITATVTGGSGGINASAAGNSVSNGTVVWSNSNNVSFGMAGSTITATATFSQTNQTGNLTATGNTLATNSTSATYAATGIVFAASGGLSFGVSNGSVVGSVPANATTVSAVASANVLGTNNRYAVEDHQHAGLNTVSVAGNTSGNTTAGAGSLVLAGGPNITLSGATAAGGMTLSVSGQAVTGARTISTWEPWPIENLTATAFLSVGTNTSATATLLPFNLPVDLSAARLVLIQSVSFITMGTSSGRQTMTVSAGIYSRPTGTASTVLSKVTDASYSLAVTYNNSSITFNQPTSTDGNGYTTNNTNSAGLNISSGYTGLKLVEFPVNKPLSAGAYWLGLLGMNVSNSNSGGLRFSYLGNQMTLTNLAPIGSFSSAYSTGTNIYGGSGGNWLLGAGSYTLAGLNSLPNTVSMSQITQDLTVRPYFRFVATA